MSKKAQWFVRLGATEWIRYTYARKPEDGLRLIGSVRRGAQVGALGETALGEYVQVVGDFVVVLNRRQISKAVAVAPESDRRGPFVQTQVRAPVVVIKRRRIPLLS